MNIVHDQQQRVFYAELNNEKAVLQYQLNGNSIDFYRTFVPDVFRGQGVAKALVTEGFAWAEQNDLTIDSSCWYAKKKTT